MAKYEKPRDGSLAFYPRKRVKKETPSFRTTPNIKIDKVQPINFLAYKAGMARVFGINAHAESTSAKQKAVMPVTVLEVPPLKVFGFRAYSLNGKNVLADLIADKTEQVLKRKIKGTPVKKKKTEENKNSKEKFDFEKNIEKIGKFSLLVHTQPKLTGIGKKKPEVSELALSGSKEEQFNYVKEILGKEVSFTDVFSKGEFIDIKATTKGKGIQGPVKRFGVKIQGRKAKTARIVGSIGPWNPSNVMFQVARAGQMGYHSRTEYNKKVLFIGTKEEIEKINPKSGFTNYGNVKNEFILLQGSVAGPVKRCIALRKAIRKKPSEKIKIDEVDLIAA